MHQIAVILTDAERRIIWVNNDFESITGYELNEVVGMSPGRLLQGPATEPDAIERIRRGLAGKEPFKDAITNYRKNGEPYLCKLVIHPIYNYLDQLTNYLAFEVDGSKVKNDHRITVMNLERRYRSSSLRGVNELKLYDRIVQSMEVDKLYLDPNLTLKKLSDHLDSNTKYLSQVINRYGQQNFMSFINGYRVDDIKEQLDSEAHLDRTYFGIAQQCGFKNKSTFYKVFRDFTGLTPKGYADQYSKR